MKKKNALVVAWSSPLIGFAVAAVLVAAVFVNFAVSGKKREGGTTLGDPGYHRVGTTAAELETPTDVMGERVRQLYGIAFVTATGGLNRLTRRLPISAEAIVNEAAGAGMLPPGVSFAGGRLASAGGSRFIVKCVAEPFSVEVFSPGAGKAAPTLYLRLPGHSDTAAADSSSAVGLYAHFDNPAMPSTRDGFSDLAAAGWIYQPVSEVGLPPTTPRELGIWLEAHQLHSHD